VSLHAPEVWRGTEQCKVIIPTHLRAGDVTTLGKVVPADKAILSVPADQEDVYREAYPDVEMDIHPASIRGLPAKRQYIYDRFGDVMMVDDDLVVTFHFEHATGTCTIDPETTYTLIQRLAQNAKDAGVYLFGFSPYPDVRNFAPQLPFKITGFVIGGTLGMLKGSKLAFNPSITAADDYWISGLNAYHHRMALIDLRYKITSKGHTFRGKGGTSAQRTMDTERRDNDTLRKYFGDEIIPVKKRSGYSKGKSGHDAQRTLRLPF
jgi:TET-associated glycosyltransferase-like protein